MKTEPSYIVLYTWYTFPSRHYGFYCLSPYYLLYIYLVGDYPPPLTYVLSSIYSFTSKNMGEVLKKGVDTLIRTPLAPLGLHSRLGAKDLSVPDRIGV